MIRVGDRLKRERLAKGLTLEEVAKATKIRPEFLDALEKGEYKKLPSSAYISGFIKNYASFLGLPQKETLAIFRREFNEREFLGVLPESFTHTQENPLSGFRFRSTSILILLGVLFILGYIFFQYKAAIVDPAVIIISPRENETIASQVVTVVGKTDQNVVVTVNDVPSNIDRQGVFQKDINVFTGQVTITIKAINNFGRKTTIVRHIVVQ